MRKIHSTKKIFAAAASGILLTAALGLTPAAAQAIAADASIQDKTSLAQTQQSEEIARLFDEVNRVKSLSGENFWSWDNLPGKMKKNIRALAENPKLINDRVFWAWEPLTRHWSRGIRDIAFDGISIFNESKKEYAQHLLQNQAAEWALSGDHRIRWGGMNTIHHVAENYPDLLPQAIEIIESQIRSRDSRVQEDAIRNAGIVGKLQVSRRSEMLDMMQEMARHGNDRIRWVALYQIAELVRTYKPGEMDIDLAEDVFDTAKEEQNLLENWDMALEVARVVALHAPRKLMAPLLEMGKKALAVDIDDHDGYPRKQIDLKEAGMWRIMTAGESDPALFDDAYDTILPYLKSANKYLVDSAIGALADMSVKSGLHVRETFDLIVPFLDAKDSQQKLSALRALGQIGEKHEEFAKIPFDAARPGITKGNDRHMRAHSTGVIGAIGAAHTAFREEAVALVKTVALNDREDGTVRDVAFSELAAIGAADDGYAEKIFTWAKEQSANLDVYNKNDVGKMVGKIGLGNCDKFEEARNILKEHFGMAFAIDEKFGGNNIDGCRAMLKENKRETNLPSGLVYTADDYSLQ